MTLEGHFDPQCGGNVLLRTGLENRRPHPGREVPTSTTSWLEQNP